MRGTEFLIKRYLNEDISLINHFFEIKISPFRRPKQNVWLYSHYYIQSIQ